MPDPTPPSKPLPPPLDLGKRERQLAEILYRLGESPVSAVRAELADPPGYSAVRAMLNLLVRKRVLATRRDGKRLLYRPAGAVAAARRSALKGLVRTFFAGAPADAAAALVDGSAGRLSAADLKRLRDLIDRAEREAK